MLSEDKVNQTDRNLFVDYCSIIPNPKRCRQLLIALARGESMRGRQTPDEFCLKLDYRCVSGKFFIISL